MKRISINLMYVFLALALSCTTTYKNQDPTGKKFIPVTGTSLSGNEWKIPGDIKGKKAILLIGFVQNSQFDIDRWLIGFEQMKVKTTILEIPTIKGLFPRIFQKQIDEGMRNGIPDDLWKAVITIYKDGRKVQEFLGNEKPGNARVILLNKESLITYFYDRGFSVSALMNLVSKLQDNR